MKIPWYIASAMTASFMALVLCEFVGCNQTAAPKPTESPPAAAAPAPSMAAIKDARRRELMTARPTEYPHAKQDDLVRALGGEGVVAILHDPDRVEAVLLSEPKNAQTTPPHEYEPSTDAVLVDAEVGAHVVEVLLDPQLHWVIPKGAAKACFPVYGVRLSYLKADDHVDLYLCFLCDDVAVYANGKHVPYAQVQFAVEQLLGDVLKIFPDDPVLKHLSGRGPVAAGPPDPYGRPIGARDE